MQYFYDLIKELPAAAAVAGFQGGFDYPLRQPRKLWQSVPRTNQSHPLSQGLIGCWLPGVSGGLDLTGHCNLTKLGSATVNRATSEGMGSYTPGGNTGGTWANASPPALYSSWTRCSLFWRGRIFDAFPGFTNSIGLAINNTNTSPYYAAMIGQQPSWSAPVVEWSDHVGGYQTLAYPDLSARTSPVSIGASFDTAGGNVSSYVDGSPYSSAGWGTGGASGQPIYTTPAFYLGGNSGSPGNGGDGASVLIGCFWNRTLNAAEMRMLNDDPYCFLIFPEDELFASFVNPGGAVIPPPPVFGNTLPLMGVG